MKLFKKFKKDNTTCNCCGNSDLNEKLNIQTDSSIKILGSGCKKCNQLEDATKEALNILGMKDTIDHVQDFAEIAAYGVMSTPALVVDNKVLSYGKVLKAEEIVELIRKARG